MLNFPTIVTLFRLVLTPVIASLILVPVFMPDLMPEKEAAWAALGLYVIAALTDALDGWLARRKEQETAFGAILDRAADKILVSGIFIALIAAAKLEIWAILAVIIMIAREFLVTGLREHLGEIVKIPVSRAAQFKTAAQMIAGGLLIAAPIVPFSGLLGVIMLYLATFLSVFSGALYLKTAWPHLKNSS